MTSYKDVVEFLFEQYLLTKKGVDAYKPDLSNIHSICEIIGNPQKNLKFIHVAGTNGKGSVCNFCIISTKNQAIRWDYLPLLI